MLSYSWSKWKSNKRNEMKWNKRTQSIVSNEIKHFTTTICVMLDVMCSAWFIQLYIGSSNHIFITHDTRSMIGVFFCSLHSCRPLSINFFLVVCLVGSLIVAVYCFLRVYHTTATTSTVQYADWIMNEIEIQSVVTSHHRHVHATWHPTKLLYEHNIALLFAFHFVFWYWFCDCQYER